MFSGHFVSIPCRDTKSTAVQYGFDICSRGNVAGRSNDHWRTNDSFLRRQADYLQFISTREDLQTRLPADLLPHTWEASKPHLLVTEEGAIVYLEHRALLKRDKCNAANRAVVPDSDVVNLDDLFDGGDDEPAGLKRGKQRQISPWVNLAFSFLLIITLSDIVVEE